MRNNTSLERSNWQLRNRRSEDSARYAKIVKWSDEDACYVGAVLARRLAVVMATTKKRYLRHSAKSSRKLSNYTRVTTSRCLDRYPVEILPTRSKKLHDVPLWDTTRSKQPIRRCVRSFGHWDVFTTPTNTRSRTSMRNDSMPQGDPWRASLSGRVKVSVGLDFSSLPPR